jgi:TM2 domain-containing membrane protein YozV
LTYFQKLVREFHGSPFRSEALIQSALTWFTLGKYNESKDYLSHIEFEGDNSSLYRQKQSALLAANLLMQSKWRGALAYLDDSHSPEAYPLNVSLKLISLKGTQLAYKSPLAAGFLSAIIPGLGKIYAQRTVDGLYSLLTIGLAGWQAYDGFHKDGLSSFKGWAFGVLGSILYIGNIYGSAVSVHVRIRQKLYDEVRVLISAHF